MLKGMVLVMMFFGAGSIGCGLLAASPEISQSDTLAHVRAPSGEVLILDVRSPSEYAAGHVPGSVNIPHSQVAARVAEVAGFKDRDVVLYCESGFRVRTAEKALTEAGFTRLRHLAGDMRAWRAQGLPLAR